MTPLETLLQTILSRRSISPKRLVEPGPNEQQIEELIKVATCVPDHGRLRPWRFVVFPQQSRVALADVFEQALLERLPEANTESCRRAREKAGRGPVLLGIIVRLADDTKKAGNPKTERVSAQEQYASAGAALQNILLTTQAMGYSAYTSSGRAIRTNTFRTALGLSHNEQFLCFISIGTTASDNTVKRRPDPSGLFSVWSGPDRVT